MKKARFLVGVSGLIYLTETSSTRKDVGNETSVVARNWMRTVWPAYALRLYGPLSVYTPAVPLFWLLNVAGVESNVPAVFRTST